MIRINAQYTDYFDGTDPAYPGGKAVDTSNGDSEDGTPYKATWMNDVNGFHQAAIVEAKGKFEVSNKPDKVGSSEILNAIKTIMNNRIEKIVDPYFILERLSKVDGEGSGLDAALFCGKPPEYYLSAAFAGFHIKNISGIDAVIPWAELGMSYNADSDYIIFISPHGVYKEFINFPCEAKEDGLHVYPQRFIDGKIVEGTRTIKWGTFKWGEVKWGAYDPIKINIQIKEALIW